MQGRDPTSFTRNGGCLRPGVRAEPASPRQIVVTRQPNAAPVLITLGMCLKLYAANELNISFFRIRYPLIPLSHYPVTPVIPLPHYASEENMATTDQIVDTAVELGERKSWEAVRLQDIAAALGITLDEVRTHFQKKDDIVDAWFERADRTMLKTAQASDFPYLTTRQRLHRLIMTWLGAFHPYRRTTRQMIYGKLGPGHIEAQAAGLMRVSRTVEWMREAAVHEAMYIRRALEDSGLAAIYLAAFFYWMNDDSAGSARTSRFLEGSLLVADKLGRLIHFNSEMFAERTGDGKTPQSI